MYDRTCTFFYHLKSPEIKWAANLVIADDPLIFLRGLCGYVWVTILTLSPPRVSSFRMFET